MNRDEALGLAEKVLSAWNRQDVEAVVSCYTEDCLYLDPNTKGPVVGRERFRRYLGRLFKDWKMHWSLREFYLFEAGNGGAFLWRAELTPATGGKTEEVEGMDLVLLEGNRISRNEVYFDRMSLLEDR